MSEKKPREIGIDVTAPSNPWDGDRNDPFYGTLSVRGQILKGTVLKAKAQKTVVVQIDKMKYGSIILEKKEYVYLKRILNISGYAEDFQTQKSLQRLSDEMKNAQIVNEEDMPEDVIRFNSKIMVFSENGWEKQLQLVIPSEKDAKKDKISILTPMGSALFGYSEGDTIEWDFPSGTQKIKIVAVTQDTTQRTIDIPI